MVDFYYNLLTNEDSTRVHFIFEVSYEYLQIRYNSYQLLLVIGAPALVADLLSVLLSV